MSTATHDHKCNIYYYIECFINLILNLIWTGMKRTHDTRPHVPTRAARTHTRIRSLLHVYTHKYPCRVYAEISRRQCEFQTSVCTDKSRQPHTKHVHARTHIHSINTRVRSGLSPCTHSCAKRVCASYRGVRSGVF